MANSRNGEIEKRSSRTPAWALVGVAIVAPQILGGATPRTELAVLALACAACICAMVSLHGSRRPFGVMPFAGWAGLTATAWTCVQILPLPAKWLFTPESLRGRELAALAGLLDLDSSRATLSWAPGSTRASLALAATLTALLLASVAVSRAGHRDFLVRGVAASSVVMALVALAHGLLRLDRVFDWYLPQQARPPILLAPLMNSNHLAGHLALGFPACLAFGLRAKRVDERIAWLGLAFIVLTTGMLTLSRGGVAALGIGGSGYLLIHLLRPPRQEQQAPRRLVIALASTVAVVVLAAYFTADLVAEEFVGADSRAKVSSFKLFLPLLAENRWAGMGRGALGDASSSVVAGNTRALYAENLPLHWALEWGVPAAVLIAGLLLISLAQLRPRRTSEWALLAGLLALVAQNMVDFSLELAGVSCVAAIALGCLLSREPTRAGALRWLPRPELRTAGKLGCAVAFAALLGALGPLTTKSRPELRARLEATLDSDQGTFDAAQHAALTLYPMDRAFIVLGAARAVRKDSRDALRWLNLSMDVAPSWAAPHIQAAYWLESRGKLSQGAFEIQLSFERDVAPTWAPADAFLKRNPKAFLAREMLPEGSGQRRWIAESLTTSLFKYATGEETQKFVDYVLSEYPDSGPAHARGVDLALRQDDLALAQERAAKMLEDCGETPQSMATLLRVLVRAARPSDALRAFDAAPPTVRADKDVMLEALAAAGASFNVARVSALTEDLFAHYGTTAEMRAGLHWHASVQFEGVGELGQALSHAQRAYELSNDPAMLERVHGVARRAGIMQVAMRAATELCHVGHRREVYCQR